MQRDDGLPRNSPPPLTAHNRYDLLPTANYGYRTKGQGAVDMGTMKRTAMALALIGIGALAGTTLAQERVDLTAPIAKVSTQNCALDYFVIDVGNSRIKVDLKCNN